ncbi:MAG: cytochrome c biogenesis protein CcdA [Methanocalculus sp.]|uniref:cytochrome c biogenesis CcdA family protein n=1 Tax=Methanocalculus sp. TaxID=2004547 RepID=UPI0027222BA5|nr:cytochrome c biogenesis protein CcdA [Methanocalculus sp.]MDO9539960.1 cytochrome c biogenesis protein CcdA [Methanocalculus sp.]
MITPETVLLSFLAGVYTPLGAVCVIPLYPGYLAYLVSQARNDQQRSPLILGLLVTAGVIGSMLLFGLLSIIVFNQSISAAIATTTPIIYTLLALLGAGMILGLDPGRLFPGVKIPTVGSTTGSALLYGGFFGLVALPCNPAGLIMIFALQATIPEAALSIIHFIIFGFGMAIPLLLLSLLSEKKVSRILQILIRHQIVIKRGAGAVILTIALYYLTDLILSGTV